jgi:hypothetical protein
MSMLREGNVRLGCFSPKRAALPEAGQARSFFAMNEIKTEGLLPV